MYIAVRRKDPIGKVECSGQSEGQVKRILIQKGLNFLDYDIRYIEEYDKGENKES